MNSRSRTCLEPVVFMKNFYSAVACRLSGDIAHENIVKEEIIMANMESPLAGKILEIKVKEGDRVTEDDVIIVVESMKMENTLFPPANGTVKEIKVKVGDRVNEGDILAVIE